LNPPRIIAAFQSRFARLCYFDKSRGRSRILEKTSIQKLPPQIFYRETAGRTVALDITAKLRMSDGCIGKAYSAPAVAGSRRPPLRLGLLGEKGPLLRDAGDPLVQKPRRLVEILFRVTPDRFG